MVRPATCAGREKILEGPYDGDGNRTRPIPHPAFQNLRGVVCFRPFTSATAVRPLMKWSDAARAATCSTCRARQYHDALASTDAGDFHLALEGSNAPVGLDAP